MFHNARSRLALVISVFAFALAVGTRASESVPLSAATIRGSSVYTPLELFAAYRDELGRPADRARSRSVLDAVAAMYTRDGYSQPELRVDDALLASGILQIEVFEPRLTHVTLAGDTGPYRRTLEALCAELQNMQPIRRSTMQRTLARMRELPGLSVSASTQRDASERNGYVLAVEATFDPVDGVVRASNRGTEEIGPNFIVAQTVANGLLSSGEKLGLLFTAATQIEEYRAAGAFVDMPLGAHGTRAFLMGFASDSEPHAAPGEPLDRYARQRATLRITYPLAPLSRFDLSLAGTLEAEDFDIRRDGVQLREERLRVLQLGSRVSWRNAGRTQYLATLEVRKGIDDFGAGLQAADLTEDLRREDFLLTRLNLVRLTRFDERWTLRMDILAQHSGYVLPYSERFKIGGERLGRGFEVTEIAGDRGAGFKLELRRLFAPSAGVLGKPSLYGFYDLGAAWSQDVSGRASAASAGLGIAAHAGRVTGYLEIAKPLTRPDVEGRKSATVFAEISVPF
jgi:hemolysin activation/secretion protein